ncbi:MULTISPECIES: class I SAM-dependent methyltransferase [unclassified Nonomuraea]|uniref:class I SAM-dependent methyltransferase n=1 Tax=Nonomuraea sp. NPDC003804 TaxID=3154547 RepID=UPI0033A10629
MEAAEIRRAVELEDRHWWYRERRAILARELRRIGRPGRALDVGAAGGGNTRVFQRYGWHALAVDRSGTAVAHARRRGVAAVMADLCGLPLGEAEFDLVTALDVLEHIDDDHAAAAEIARVLKPGGTAFIAVPCDMRLWSAHDVALGHVRRYTRQGLTEVIEGSGLVIERLWSWNVLLRPVAALRRRNATGCDLQALPGPVNLALTAVVMAERYLPVSGLPGVSLMARARRRP